MRILLYPGIEEPWLGKLRAISPEVEVVVADDETEAVKQVREAEALYGRLTPAMLAAAEKLQWVQATGIGLEGSMFPELIASDVVMTNMRGVYSDHIADHVFGYILTFARGLHVYLRQQLSRTWQPGVPIHYLPETTLGIIGLGGIGAQVARRGRFFGMRVLAVDPSPKGDTGLAEQVWGMDGLPEMLGQADFVVICAPHTPVTERLFGAAQLRAMKPTAYLMNIGRGVIVQLEALTQALQTGEIAGAALDVFEREPLPADHPLWEMENVIVTPHVADTGPYVHDRRMELFLENARRFVAGQPLLTVVDKAQWC